MAKIIIINEFKMALAVPLREKGVLANHDGDGNGNVTKQKV